MVKLNAQMMTGHAGVFAGGDMVPDERTVTVAAGHGKKAARNIDAWLRGAAYQQPAKHELAGFARLNPWYYSDAPLTVQPVLDAVRREAASEGGNCFECDSCYGVGPDNAVVKLGPGNRFRFNYDYRKGCGMCVEMPCGAIEMVADLTAKTT